MVKDLPKYQFIDFFSVEECYAMNEENKFDIISKESDEICGDSFLQVKMEISEPRSISMSFRSFQFHSGSFQV